jgi:hypothetical protein
LPSSCAALVGLTVCFRLVMNAKSPTRTKPETVVPAIMPPFAPGESPPDELAMVAGIAVGFASQYRERPLYTTIDIELPKWSAVDMVGTLKEEVAANVS